MKNNVYTPSELLEILRKVNPDAYRHLVWLIRACLKMEVGSPGLKKQTASATAPAVQTGDEKL